MTRPLPPALSSAPPWHVLLRLAGRVLVGAVAGVAAGALLYAMAAFGLGQLGGRPAPAPVAVEAYVVSNGVHTDIVLPVRAAGVDWTAIFPPGDAPAGAANAEFVALGWGDRDFYLHTPQWRDLTVGRALHALSGRGRALLHVTWLRRADLPTRAWHLPLDAAGHATVVRHVRTTVAAGADGRAAVIAGAHHADNDAFYEAHGAYDAFTTCNTWTGAALRAAGVPVGPWTPFAPNVVQHLVPFSAGPAGAGTATPAGRPGR